MVDRQAGLEWLVRHRIEQGLLDGEVLPDSLRPGSDPLGLIIFGVPECSLAQQVTIAPDRRAMPKRRRFAVTATRTCLLIHHWMTLVKIIDWTRSGCHGTNPASGQMPTAEGRL